MRDESCDQFFRINGVSTLPKAFSVSALVLHEIETFQRIGLRLQLRVDGGELSSAGSPWSQAACAFVAYGVEISLDRSCLQASLCQGVFVLLGHGHSQPSLSRDRYYPPVGRLTVEFSERNPTAAGAAGLLRRTGCGGSPWTESRSDGSRPRSVVPNDLNSTRDCPEPEGEIGRSDRRSFYDKEETMRRFTRLVVVLLLVLATASPALAAPPDTATQPDNGAISSHRN